MGGKEGASLLAGFRMTVPGLGVVREHALLTP